MAIIDMVTRSRRRARREIEASLRQGLLSLDEIASKVGEGLDEEALQRMVRESWQKMSTTPVKRPTALDRLQAAFDALDGDGVMARHHPVEGRSDAHALSTTSSRWPSRVAGPTGATASTTRRSRG
jgi:hypothetical protein